MKITLTILIFLSICFFASIILEGVRDRTGEICMESVLVTEKEYERFISDK